MVSHVNIVLGALSRFILNTPEYAIIPHSGFLKEILIVVLNVPLNH